jgi:hypothetical protein
MATFGSKCKLMAALAAAGALLALPVSPALAATAARAIPATAATAIPPPTPPLLCVPQLGGLYGVSVPSPSTTNYWKVGNTNAGAALFNYGTTTLTGMPAAPSYLRGVAAIGPASAVAVGYTVTGGTANILIMTGTTTAATPVTGLPTFGAGTSSYLYGVAVSAPNNAWAVGYTVTGSTIAPLLLHGTGTNLATWTVTPLPSTLPANSFLCGVTTTTISPPATLPSSFAVGGSVNGGVTNALILKGLGPSCCAAWVNSPFPVPPSTDSYLKGVAAQPFSATSVDAYAVGSTTTNTPHRGHPLIEVWNGTAWAVATPVPDPGTTASRLYGVTIRPTKPFNILGKSDVWAVGFTRSGSTFHTLVEHDLVYKGTTGWALQPSGNPEPNDGFFGVSATVSTTSAWAVGRKAPTAPFRLTEQWNGTSW